MTLTVSDRLLRMGRNPSAPPAAPWTPARLGSALRLWADAASLSALSDGDTLASWPDRSGGGHNLSQAAPSRQPVYRTGLLGGRGGVRFDGADDFLATPDAPDLRLPALTVAVVLARRTGPTGYQSFLNKRGGDSDVAWNLLLASGSAALGNYNGSGLQQSPAAPPVGVPCLIEADSDGGTSRLWLAQTLVSAAPVPLGITPTTCAAPVRLGNYDPYNEVAAVDVGEVVVCAGVLGDSDRAALRGYLRGKWGV